MSRGAKFCIRCGALLVNRADSGRARKICPKDGCGWVFYGNPTPVVASLVEHPNGVILARNHGWPPEWYGLIAGYIESKEAPEAAALRELQEELGLTGRIVGLIGVYPFEMKNELIIAYHVYAEGEVTLGDELEAYRFVSPTRLKAWPVGTGLAVSDWLIARGFDGTPQWPGGDD
jgi:NAD+ diphosphatase